MVANNTLVEKVQETMMSMHDKSSIAREIYECFNSRDFDRALGYVANDLEWENTGPGDVFRGSQGFRQFLDMWAKAFSDAKVEVTNTVCSGDWCAVEFIGRGTHNGTLTSPSGNIPATGKHIEMKFCEVFQFRNGKIYRGRTYFDTMAMLKQLGVAPQTRQAGM